MANLEEAAAGFLSDVREIERDYNEDGRALSDRLRAVELECKKKTEQARSEFWQASRDMNARYMEKIGGAAIARGLQADEAGQDITDAANALTGLLGGPCHDSVYFNSDVVRARLEQAADNRERLREQREKDEKMNRTRLIFL